MNPSSVADSPTLADVRALEERHILQIYRRAGVAFVRGAGARLYDTENKEYLDFISGIGVTSLGHAHPGLAAAIAQQAKELLHCSNLYFHPLQGRVAERLASLTGLPRAFLCNSGTEAIEACLKFVRRFWYSRGDHARRDIVALEGSFHGRTYGSLSVTWDVHYRQPFSPLLPDVHFVSPGNPLAIRSAVTSTTAAVILEPIQGEGGVRPLSPAFAHAVQDACDRHGALLIADEVQSGLGRTGSVLYSPRLGLKPNIVALGKALGGGVPVGAALMTDDVAQTISFGDHGTTYGGNLLACRAALVFLDLLADGSLIENVRRVGAVLESRLRSLEGRHPQVTAVRGAGLMWGIELNADATPVIEKALTRGLLVNRTNQTVVRLLPPLTIEEPDLHRGLDILEDVLGDVGRQSA